MHKALVAAALSAVAAFGSILPPPARAADPVPATQPAGEQTQVPVREVVLFSSGVGYFEHFGTVAGNGTTELRFKTQQVNDVLKSLVLQDLDKGRVGVITYPSQDPVAKTLRSFQVDITANPALHDLLNQLRGAKVTLHLTGDKVSGTVLGAEKKQKPVGDKDKGQVVDVWVVNLLVGAAIRPVPLDDVRNVELEDPKLRDELQRALAALSQARDQDKKPVTINFQGRGDRRVRIGYVVEAPVWKTSYRLLLDGQPVAGGGAGGEKVDAKPDAKPDPAQGAAKPGAGGHLQGWAIVENQTDNDWTDVQLSLVSGRPISFIQDLYSPLYVPRPVVQPELYASLRPQTYDAGLAPLADAQRWAEGKERLAEETRSRGNRQEQADRLYARKAAPAATPPPAPGAAAGGLGGFGGEYAGKDAKELGDMDAAASVASAASATKLGELFQYTVGSVTLPRQKSAMIPVVTDGIEAERLSIYNQAVLPKNPLYGARLKNTTGKHLLQGPITVIQGGAYAGDARIDDVPPGQERLISYGIDLQVLVQAQNGKQDNAVQTGKIVKGVLHLTRKLTASQEYVADNKGEASKTLVVEHARRGGGWKLVEPAKADETTDALYRFKDKLEPGKPKKLTVTEEVVTGETIAILPMDVGQIDAYLRTGPIPQPVKDALAKAATFKGQLSDTERQIGEWQQKVAQITQEQQRLRENMKTVAQNTDYYARLMKKLNDQETQIETLQKEVEGLQKQRDKQRKDLEDYLAELNVG